MASACPICNKATDPEFRPFCSGRCADIDLGRWFNGTYAIADDEERPADARETDDDPSLTRH